MKYDYTEVLKDLVRIDTTNPPGNEKRALDYIQKILEQEGIDSTIYESAPGRGNLLACLPADKMCLMKVGQTARRLNGR